MLFVRGLGLSVGEEYVIRPDRSWIWAVLLIVGFVVVFVHLLLTLHLFEQLWIGSVENAEHVLVEPAVFIEENIPIKRRLECELISHFALGL